MTPDKQLTEWVKGNSIHNKERNECCPDFSCCGGCLAPEDERKRFVKATREDDGKTKMIMLGWFLRKMLSDRKVEGWIIET